MVSRTSLAIALAFLVPATVSAESPSIAADGASPAIAETVAELVAPAPGEYKRLDLWTSLKLGSAVFVNPQAVRDAKFAYLFDLSNFTKLGSENKVWTLAKDGQIGFGLPQKGRDTLEVVSLKKLSELSGSNGINDPAQLSVILARTGGKVVAAQERLLGAMSAGAFIKASGPSSLAVRSQEGGGLSVVQ